MLVSILTRIRSLLSKERALAMTWKVERQDRRSILVGTAHFFPYSFRKALRRCIRGADTVLLEGPLDDDARRKVIEAGASRQGASLFDALDSRTIRRINAVLAAPPAPAATSQLYWELLRGGTGEDLSDRLRRLKPWMAFFHLWTEYRQRDGWTYSLDADAARVAARLGKNVRYLETIEEQIATLDRIPLDRIVSFLRDADWDAYRRDYVRLYLAGDLAGLMAAARDFPSYCHPVIEQRDPVLLERMLPFLERGNTAAFVGITHCRGLIALLQARGYRVTQVSPRGGPQPP